MALIMFLTSMLGELIYAFGCLAFGVRRYELCRKLVDYQGYRRTARRREPLIGEIESVYSVHLACIQLLRHSCAERKAHKTALIRIGVSFVSARRYPLAVPFSIIISDTGIRVISLPPSALNLSVTLRIRAELPPRGRSALPEHRLPGV